MARTGHFLRGGISRTSCPALNSWRPTRDLAAQSLQRLAVFSRAAHCGVQAETVDFGAQRLLELRLPGHGAP